MTQITPNSQSARAGESSVAIAAAPGPVRFDYGSTEAVAPPPRPGIPPAFLLAAAVIALAFAVLFEINGEQLVHVWRTNPNWSHGFIVPLFALYLAGLHRKTLRTMIPKPSLAGLALLIYGIGTQVLFRITGQPFFSNLSILVVLFGLVLWILGVDFLKILWLPICYLLFMINPPQVLYVKITTPLQYLAASAGVHMLPLFGINAMRSATQVIIHHGTHWLSLDVAEACSGMHMLVAFFALAVALAYSTNRPMWQKVFLGLCALPIAIFCNALRVTLTGVLFVTLGNSWARGSTHADLGLLMLLPAIVLQLSVGWVLDHLFVEDHVAQSPVPVRGSAPLGAGGPA